VNASRDLLPTTCPYETIKEADFETNSCFLNDVDAVETWLRRKFVSTKKYLCNMKRELKKLVVFGMIITLFTSAYTAFLNTVMKQGFSSDHFFINWLSLIPKTYLLLLPFVLITGRITSIWVNRMFRDKKGAEQEA
jgi:hypothetical protein